MKAKLIILMLSCGLLMAACGSKKPQEQTVAVDSTAIETVAVDSLTQNLEQNANSIKTEADSVNNEVDKLLEDI